MNRDVYPCPILYDEKHKMRNLLNNDFDEVWSSGVEELKLTNWSKNTNCKSCSLYKFCGGGCYALVNVSNKDYDMRCRQIIKCCLFVLSLIFKEIKRQYYIISLAANYMKYLKYIFIFYKA